MDGFILDGGVCSFEAAGVTTFGGGPASGKFLASGIGGFNTCDVFSTGGNTGSGNLTSKLPWVVEQISLSENCLQTS